MRQMENTISIPVIILTLGFFSFVSLAQESQMPPEDTLLDSELDFDRRPHDFGLGKRVFVTEYKRLPLYNVGPGKTSHLYNFGLGKRSKIEDESDDLEEYDEYPYNEEDQMPELELYHDDNMQSVDKRQKYSFGLGKRLHRYDFGLGKRSQAAVNRPRLYNFGLGKRNRLYNFGLGKRPYNQGPVPSRFNFGLGKRSYDSVNSKNAIAKREVHEQRTSEVAESKPSTRVEEASTNKFDKLNNTSDLESHEIMGHSDKSQLSKRSPSRDTFEMARTPAYRMNSGFSRQFRKPLYNFGLGKRTTSLDDFNSQNYKSSE